MTSKQAPREGLSCEMQAPVSEVTLMEDRARVLRSAKLVAKAGRNRFELPGVAPVLVDKSLLVRITASVAKVHVVDVRVSRQIVVKRGSEANGDELAELRAERRKLEKEMAGLVAQVDREQKYSQGVQQTQRLTLAELGADVAWGKELGGDWHDELAKLRSRYLEGSDKLLQLAAKQEEREHAMRGLDARIVVLQSPAEHEEACLLLDIDCDAAGEVALELSYVVPGACWRPYHTAHLQGPGESLVAFKTEACVWQNTGEDWEKVRIVLSTERASLGVTAPLMVTDYLSLRRKSELVQVEARDEVVESLVEEGQATKVLAQLPGIDDGGSTLSIRVPNLANIASDGRPHRLFVSEFEAEAQTFLLATPELNPCVVTVTKLENAGASPLLAGPVDLIRKSGFVGGSQILYVASGERFDLGWGPEPDLRLQREIEESSESSRVLSSWNVKTHRVSIRMSNLGRNVHTVKVCERVPVSEIDKVKIEVDSTKTTGSKQADRNGFVEWDVECAASGQAKLELTYVVKKHDDVQG